MNLCRIYINIYHAIAVERRLFSGLNGLNDKAFKLVGVDFPVELDPYFLLIPKLNPGYQRIFGTQHDY
jgi:hypothetical protein